MKKMMISTKISDVGDLLRKLYKDEPTFTAGGLLFFVLILPTLLSMYLDPRLIQGESVWLKPFKFEVALCLYLLTLAYFARYLPAGLVQKRSYRIYAAIVLFSIFMEIIWIIFAASLGAASHFNASTTLWVVVYALMGIFAVTLTTATLFYGIHIWRQEQTELSKPLQVAIASSLVLTFFMTVMVAGTLSAGTGHLVGEAVTGGKLPFLGWSTEVGDLRAPHFLATHGMHVIPLLTLWSGTQSVAVAWKFTAAYTAVTLIFFLLSLNGLPIVPLG